MHVMGMCVDVEKAYDCTDIEVLKDVMEILGFNSHITWWIYEFFRERILICGTKSKETFGGLAQGSGLSPILFNLYTISLHHVNSSQCRLFQYADDFVLICYDKDFNSTKTLLQSKIIDFKARCNEKSLNFNMAKTSVVHFNRRQRDLNICVENTLLNQVQEMKYLGVVISTNGSSNEHVDFTIREIEKKCRFMNIINGCRFGVHPIKALLFYKAFVRSKAEYGASALSNMSQVASGRIKSCLNNVLRKALGLIRTTPVSVIYHMAGELPPDKRFELATAKELIKVFALNLPAKEIMAVRDRPLNSSYYRIYHQFQHIFEDVAQISESIIKPSNIKFDEDFFKGAVKNKAEASVELVRSLRLEKEADLQDRKFDLIFTDGSVHAEYTGAAFYHQASGLVQAFCVTKRLSSMSAELVALYKALEFATNNGLTNIAFLTDSLAGVQALKNNGGLNFLAHQFLALANEHCGSIEIHFIPGHMGIPHNEKVDEAAKKAFEEGWRLDLKWPLGDAIRTIEEKLWLKWSTEYIQEASVRNSCYFRIFPTVR
ncbi:uncharacterized protein LOC142224269 [Haematobia irritans]